VYVGHPAGRAHLEKTGLSIREYQGGDLAADQVLIVGPGGRLAAHRDSIAKWLQGGGHMLAIGLDELQANAFLPFRVRMKSAEYIGADFEPAGVASWRAGIGPADVHNRDPREIEQIWGGVAGVGNGVLGVANDANVVFCQLTPWHFDYEKQYNLKRTFRRASFLVSRLLANMGVSGTTPVLARFSSPVGSSEANENRWLTGLYLDQPTEMDDPYRYFNW
jgi:hypothetical protein